MRTFYIFNVNKELSILTKDSPYMLFKSFESIYKSKRNDLYIASFLYEQLASSFNQNTINKKISNYYQDSDYYMYRNNSHKYYNKYKDEKIDLEVKHSYIIVNSNTTKIELLKSLNNLNLFVCDFENKDYFWLDEIYC